MKTQYSFVTNWELEAPLQQVWDAIYNSLEWPQWWKGVVSVEEIEKEDDKGINGVKVYTWKSVLPYKLKFSMRLTEKQPMKRLKGIAFGELDRIVIVIGRSCSLGLGIPASAHRQKSDTCSRKTVGANCEARRNRRCSK